VNTNSHLQSAQETGPLFHEQTNIAITHTSLLLENIKDFFYWWYIQMPVYYILSIHRINVVLIDIFSIKLLLRNFFTPWQRKYNVINMVIGLIMKILYLPPVIFLYTLVIISSWSFFIIWILLPILTTIFLVLTPITS